MILIAKARNLIEDKERDRSGNSKSCYFVNIDHIDYVLLTYPCSEDQKEKVRTRIFETMHLINQGFHTPLTYDIDFDDDMAYEIQGRAKGKALSYRNIEPAGGEENYMNDLLMTLKILEVTDKTNLLSLLNDSKIYWENGYSLDHNSDNFVIDEEGHFTIIDLDIFKESQKRDPHNYLYVNTLPNILSSLKIKPGMPRYDECVELIRGLAPMWVEACIDFLSQNEMTVEEIKRTINLITFNYFNIDNEDRKVIIDKCFDGRTKC